MRYSGVLNMGRVGVSVTRAIPSWLRSRSKIEMRGAVDGVFEAAELVDHLKRLGLSPREDAAVSELRDLRTVELAALGDGADELPVDVVEQRLEHAPLLGRHRPPGIANVLERTGLYDDVIDAHLLHELLEVGHLHDHADGAGERSGIGVDPVGRHRDVVAARSRHRAERGHDGLAPLSE